MSAHVVIPLVEFSRYSAAVIGSLGVKLGQYDTRAIPLPITVAIPQTAFSQLLSENTILERLHHIKNVSWDDPAARHAAKQAVRDAIIKQRLPDWFTEPLLTTYNSEFQRGFVRLLPSDAGSLIDATRFEHIQGDANLFQSLMEFWANWVEYQLDLNHVINRSTLTPDSIIIQEQTQASASGVAYSRHPTHQSKSQVYIQAIKGSPDSELMEGQADEFAVDIRSWNVVFRNVRSQTRMVARASDHLESIPVHYDEQLRPALTDDECVLLAQYIQQLKHHSIQHLKASWELTTKGFMLTSIDVDEEEVHRGLNDKKSVRTLTKLYISGGNPQKAQTLTSNNPDGVGVLRSEFTYAQFGMHPAHIIHSRQREVLERQLAHTITTYQAAVSYQRVILRSQNLTSNENAQLDYAGSHEPQETNPYLGFRGGLKLVTHPELLRIEINALQAALSKQGGQIGYMLSFIRTPEELGTLIHHIDQSGLFQKSQFELWWQINTPENILNLKAYPLHRLTGVSINITTIQALLHGIDPDSPEIFERYQLDTSVLVKLMEQISETRSQLAELRPQGQPLLLHLHLEDFSRDLVASAVKLRYDGIVVKPRALEMARAIVLEEEEAFLNR